MHTKITGSGSYIPEETVGNEEFMAHEFMETSGSRITQPNDVIIRKFQAITGIDERRYAREDQNASDLGALASAAAIQEAGIDKERIDYIITAHNFGDINHGTVQSDMLPSLASRIKHKLGIKNPLCKAYDIIFGCPGWVEGLIQAHAFIQAGMAERCLVVGTETLSRVTDPHDRDSMIYSDGAGAVIVEASAAPGGIRAHHSASFTEEEVSFLFFGKSYNIGESAHTRYIKMYGRKIYEFAVTHVPSAMKACMDKSGYAITDLKKIFIHQANEKMDEAIVQRFYKLYDLEAPKDIMPMSIGKLGNSSVATVPTLYDLVRKGKLEGHGVGPGDLVLFASVGAGMNINAVVYQL